MRLKRQGLYLWLLSLLILKTVYDKVLCMKNLLVYYCCILIPFALLLLALKYGFISNTWVAILLLLYVVYRQLTDTWRLQAMGVIEKITVKLIANPLLQTKYFKELYLGITK
jgi:hypothetical protein